MPRHEQFSPSESRKESAERRRKVYSGIDFLYAFDFITAKERLRQKRCLRLKYKA